MVFLSLSDIKAAAAHKLSADGIVGKALAGHPQEIIQKFKEPLGLIVLRGLLGNLEQKGLRKSLQHGQLIDQGRVEHGIRLLLEGENIV